MVAEVEDEELHRESRENGGKTSFDLVTALASSGRLPVTLAGLGFGTSAGSGQRNEDDNKGNKFFKKNCQSVSNTYPSLTGCHTYKLPT